MQKNEKLATGRKRVGNMNNVNLTYTELLGLYERDCKLRNLSEETIIGYKNAGRYFLNFCGKDVTCSEITQELLDEYKFSLMDRYKPETVNSYIFKVSPVCLPVKVTLQELADQFSSGYTVSPGILVGGAKAENWKRQQLFMLDIDNNKPEFPIISLDDARHVLLKNNIPLAFYYYTFNSTEDLPKFRLGFIMDEVITDDNTRLIVQRGLMNLFDQVDRTCINADRIFYGTDKETVICNTCECCSIEAIIKANCSNVSNIHSNEVKECNGTLEELKNNFDLLSLMKDDNGSIAIDSDNYIMFDDCCVCGHHRDLVYYKDTNSFFCFSANGNVGGTCIDYYMITRKVDFKTALEELKSNNIRQVGTERSTIIPKVKRNNKHQKRVPILPVTKTMEENKNEKLQKVLKEFKPEKIFAMDDTGAGEILSRLCEARACYIPSLNKWLSFNNKKYWVIDEREVELNKNITLILDNLVIYANELEDGDVKNEYLKYLKKLRSASSRKNMIETAKSKMSLDIQELDKNKFLLNCQNGTLNLKTFKLQDFNWKDYITKMSNVVYDENANSEAFEKFVNDVFENDEDKIEYLQKILGYSLTGDISQEDFYILYGSKTRNGKSTLIETYAYMLGGNRGYAVNIDPSTLAEKKNKDSSKASGDIAKLQEARFISCSEPPENMALDVALIKQFTGGDTITSRALYSSEKEFALCGKLFINTNYLPRVTDETLFTSNRAKVIEFNRSFAPNEQDKGLKERLRQEVNVSGLFNWCLKGLKKFYETGADIPQSVEVATKYYWDLSNNILEFIEKELEKEPEKAIKGNELYLIYQKWCIDEGKEFQNKGAFFKQLKKSKLLRQSATINGKTERNVVVGYNLKL